jgi:hypothetical protein
MNETLLACLILGTPILAAILLIALAIQCLRQRKFVRAAICGTGSILAMLMLLLLLLLPAIARARAIGCRTQCQSNLHQFDIALSGYCYPPVNSYPAHLAQLGTNDISVKMFVCPNSGNEYPATQPEAIELSDYIYTQNLNPATPAGVTLIICPYHQPEGYHSLDSDHSTKWSPATDNNSTVEAVLQDLVDRGYSFHVSARVEEQSGGRLCSSDRWHLRVKSSEPLQMKTPQSER